METKDKKKSKWKITAGVILIIQLLLSMATVGVVLWLNIVPTLYVILLGLIFLLLLIIEYCLFYFGKKKKVVKKPPFLVEVTGLEPAASWSQTKHSTKLSYAS
mgnify:CR=1 FL=1